MSHTWLPLQVSRHEVNGIPPTSKHDAQKYSVSIFVNRDSKFASLNKCNGIMQRDYFRETLTELSYVTTVQFFGLSEELKQFGELSTFHPHIDVKVVSRAPLPKLGKFMDTCRSDADITERNADLYDITLTLANTLALETPPPPYETIVKVDT